VVFQSANRLGRQCDNLSWNHEQNDRSKLFPRGSGTAQKACILIIDNDRDFTHSAKRALEMTGRYFVSEENDASKAHQTAQKLKPDLILLDIARPEKDAGEVAARIQSDPALHGIPVVLLTALVTKAEGRPGLRIQGHPFLARPISLPELIEGIEEHMPERATL